MDSGFSVLKGLLGVFERGVYGSALVKKHIYWPTGTYGEYINAHFEKIYIGEHECLSWNWKGVDFDVFVVKEPKYIIDFKVSSNWILYTIMIMMSTYSGLVVRDDKKEGYQ